MDLELVMIEEDASLSAKTIKDRPGLLSALQALQDGKAEGILICKLDRLTRSVRDLGDLVERYFASHWSLMSVADSIDTRSASGRLILNVLACVSQWEREATAERTRDALSHLQRSGILIGGAPLGRRYEEATDDEGRRVVRVVEDEERTVAEIVRLRGENLTYRTIANISPTTDSEPSEAGSGRQRRSRRSFFERTSSQGYSRCGQCVGSRSGDLRSTNGSWPAVVGEVCRRIPFLRLCCQVSTLRCRLLF